jgi:discoidin domain receptor family protein 2
MRDITPPILAKRIRFIPYSKVKRTICLRVEIYGCSFEGFFFKIY